MGNGTKTTSYGMLKGYFPRDPTLVSAQASLGVSPEGDPGWESGSIEHLGWDSGKWEVWSWRQNGGKPQGLGYPVVAPSPLNRQCCRRIPGHAGAPVGWGFLPAGHSSPSSLCIFLERETGVNLPDHLVVVAMRGSLSTAHTGAAPGCCWTGFPGAGLPASRCSGSQFWGYFRRIWAVQGEHVETRLQRFLIPNLVAVELGCAAKELPGMPAPLRDGDPSPQRAGSLVLTFPFLHGSSEWTIQRKLREFFAIPRCLVSVFSLFLVELIRFLGEAVVQVSRPVPAEPRPQQLLRMSKSFSTGRRNLHFPLSHVSPPVVEFLCLSPFLVTPAGKCPSNSGFHPKSRRWWLVS